MLYKLKKVLKAVKNFFAALLAGLLAGIIVLIGFVAVMVLWGLSLSVFLLPFFIFMALVILLYKWLV